MWVLMWWSHIVLWKKIILYHFGLTEEVLNATPVGDRITVIPLYTAVYFCLFHYV